MKNNLFRQEEMTDVVAYFSYFDEQINRHCVDEKLNQYYADVKASIEGIAQKISRKNMMKSIKQLIVLDAKLQILFFFIEDSVIDWSGSEIIAMAEKDSKKYYQETFGLSAMSDLSHSLLFMESA